jgi:hypothetical protein
MLEQHAMIVAECSLCRAVKKVRQSQVIHAYVCPACYRQKFAPRHYCARCGKLRALSYNGPEGRYCSSCYQKVINVADCVMCGQKGPVAKRDERRGAVCDICYGRHHQAVESCEECGVAAKVETRLVNGGALCHRCTLHRNRETCARCGRLAPVYKRERNGGSVCEACNARARRAAKKAAVTTA